MKEEEGEQQEGRTWTKIQANAAECTCPLEFSNYFIIKANKQTNKPTVHNLMRLPTLIRGNTEDNCIVGGEGKRC